MTDDMLNLRGLLEKRLDAELLREMIGFAAQRLMELEVGSLTGVCFGERSPERPAQRNGYGPLRGRDLLDRLPAQAGAARSARGEARSLQQPWGHQGRRLEGADRDLAALPRFTS